MTRKDHITIGWLVVLAAFIWLRDTSWISTSDDTLPILISIPMFFWMLWPISFRKKSESLSPFHLIAAALCFIAGTVTDLTFLLGLGWTLLLWSWLIKRMAPEHISEAKKLLILPLMAFPWIALDAEPVGWWFRLSGAWITANFFEIIGLQVVHEGTQLYINSMPISVEPACSGLHTLQSMLIAGSLVAFIQIGDSPRYWWSLPLLILISWIANTIRIIAICTAAIVISKDFAMGPFHDIGGWAILFVMFLLCWFIFSLLQPKPKPEQPPSPS